MKLENYWVEVRRNRNQLTTKPTRNKKHRRKKMKKRLIVAAALVWLLAQNSLYAQPSLILPVKTELPYRITVGYGGICDDGIICDEFHTNDVGKYALDFGHPTNNPNPEIVAAAGGVVTTSRDDATGFGKHIIITHQDGYTTTYGHLSVRYVEKDVTISQGDVIGLMGTTGNSTGEHLHFVLRNKDRVSILPEPMSGLTNLYAGLVINPTSITPTDYLGLKQNNERDQRVIDFYNTHGGASTFGQVWGNPNSYLHLWPNNGDMWVQDFLKNLTNLSFYQKIKIWI